MHEDYSEFKYQCSTLPMATFISPTSGLLVEGYPIIEFSWSTIQKYHTLRVSSYGTLVGRRSADRAGGGTVCGRIKISWTFWLLFVSRQKVTREKNRESMFEGIKMRRFLQPFRYRRSSIIENPWPKYITIHYSIHGLRCREIWVFIKISLAPYPWLPIFRSAAADFLCG